MVLVTALLLEGKEGSELISRVVNKILCFGGSFGLLELAKVEEYLYPTEGTLSSS